MKFKDRLRARRLRANLTAGLAGVLALSAQGQVFELKSANPLIGVSGNDRSNPAFVDIDQDGDQDLFIGGSSEGVAENSRDNGLLLYENVEGTWVKKSAAFETDLGIQFILDTASVNVAPSFVDFDGDGDMDAFLGFNLGGVRYYQNNEGNFTLQTGSESPLSDLEFESFNSYPAAGDLNGDGVPELIITQSGSHTVYTLSDGKFIEDSSLGFDDSGVGTLHDIDGDGDLDFIVGNKYGNLTFYENVDGVLSENNSDGPFQDFDFSEYIRPAFADIDGDGNADLVLGDTGGNISLHKNVGDSYQHISYNIQGISANGESLVKPEFVDIDNDGDDDLFIGTLDGPVQFHENIGGRFFLNDEKNPLPTFDNSISYSTPSFGDIDGDGDLDCIIGDYSDPPFYYENVEGVFTAIDSIDSPFANISRGDAQRPCLEDFDGDGDLDLFVGNKYGDIIYYENVANVYSRVEIEGITDKDFGSYVSLTFGDIDSDGDRDLVIGNDDAELTVFYNNDGTLEEASEEMNPFDLNGYNLSDVLPELGDIDQDGDVDLLVGTNSGEIYYFQNQTLSSSVSTLVMEDGVRIFPNPAKHTLNVEVPWKVDVLDVQIISQTGQRVFSSKEARTNFDINTSTFTPGYYALILTGDQFLTTKKFIKID